MTSVDVRSAGVPVDPDALSAFLATCLPEPGPISRVSRLTGGISNVTLLVEAGPCRWVLRRRPVGQIPQQAHDMQREYETLRQFAGLPLPVPAVYGFCRDESVIGAPFYVMDFVEGVVVQTAADLHPITPAARAQICAELVRVLTDLHAIPLSRFPAYQPGRSRDVMARHLQRWHDRWGARPHRDLPLLDRLAEELRHRLPPGDELTFVHGDYRIGNTIVDPLGGPGAVRAVLDWELSTFGHPLTDLAHFLAYWEGTGDIRSHRAQRIAGDAGLPDGGQLAERYAALSGRSIEDLPVFVAFEHWRAAIIKEAIYQRRLTTGASSADIEDARVGVESHLAEADARLAVG